MALRDISSTTQTYWDIDPGNTTIEFRIGKPFRHQVQGQFHTVRGSVLTLGDRAGDALVQVEIDAASIDTRLEVRNGHLRQDRFLAAERFPTISFTSTRVEDRGRDTLRVFGDLTIRGITREVALDAVIEQRDGERARITASTVLDRRDFRIGPKLMGLVTGNHAAVKITLELRAGSSAA